MNRNDIEMHLLMAIEKLETQYFTDVKALEAKLKIATEALESLDSGALGGPSGMLRDGKIKANEMSIAEKMECRVNTIVRETLEKIKGMG